ncbi:hypothetical protein G7Y89_g3983 [Cudoniella acicularis]|uniref:Cytochrome P450 n=1 Tax=Cudoniella acicularis TaxID=354080 RepID=A0A8H4RSH5_9HELO|nr:hypothetical protein G7Y89_g3983 [Cudoniella acicularis]
MGWLRDILLVEALEPTRDLLGSTVILVLAICSLTYMVTRISWELQTQRSSPLIPKLPPTIPYAIPFLGNLPSIAINPQRFMWALNTPNPYAFRLFTSKWFVLQGSQNIAAFWKKDPQMIGLTAQIFCLKYLFGMPSSALQMYVADNSGFNENPAPQSTVSAHDRIDYHTHASLLSFTSGKHFPGFYNRWFKSFSARLQSLHNLKECIDLPDLLVLFERDFGLAVVEATCGTILERLNPNLAQDLAFYARCTPPLSKGLPRRFAPDAYSIRDKLLENIKEWHRIAKGSFKPSDVEADGDRDPFWGSEFIRSRQKMFKGFSGFDANAAAASDLGFIWALTFNIVPTMMWVVLEIHKDSMLRSRIRAELKASGLLRQLQSNDVKKILSLPRLQAHTDRVAWNTGINNSYPVDKFWAERFLFYANDPDSGPIVKSSIIQAGSLSEAQDELQKHGNQGPIFSDKSTVGYYLPYGGGARICPGRHFAKRAIMTAAAMMTGIVDIEILASEKEMEMDSRAYGLGVQRPVGRIVCKIRRWQG